MGSDSIDFIEYQSSLTPLIRADPIDPCNRYYKDDVKSFDRKVLGKLCQFLQVRPGDLLVLVDQGDLFGTMEQSHKEAL